MARVEITFKIMPEGPATDLNKISVAVKKEIEVFGGVVRQHVIEPIGFGIQAIMITFIMDESKGATDPLEEKIARIPEVNSVEVSHVTRAFG